MNHAETGLSLVLIIILVAIVTLVHIEDVKARTYAEAKVARILAAEPGQLCPLQK